MISLVLASASPARLATLRSAGLEPSVRVSGVDEDALIARWRVSRPHASAAETVLMLARAKGEDVAACAGPDELVIACDSMLEIAGEVVGKPHDASVAIERWQAMRGGSGVLHTGHWVIRGERAVGRTASTRVFFADLSDDEIAAYVATGEPLKVAGAFTVDALGGPFVTRIEGDFHNVVGISLPLVRELFRDLGVDWTRLWSRD